MRIKACYNVAIVGCGAFARARHIPNIEAHARFRLYAAVDAHKKTADEIRDRYDVAYVTQNDQDVIHDPHVDVVIIATRHDVHGDQIIRAARAGKAVLTEKPMAMTAGECARVTEVVHETGIAFGVAFNRRLSPFSKHIKSCLAHAPRPVLVEYHWINAPWNITWPFDKKQGGGKLVSSGGHMFDYVHALLDSDPVRAMAGGGRFAHGEAIDTLDSAAVLVEYADGSVASFVTGEVGHKDYPQERMSFFTRHGVIELDNFIRLRTYGFDTDPIELAAQDKGLGHVLDAMLCRMEGKPTALADARAGFLATAVAEAASCAVETHQVQKIAQVDHQAKPTTP